MRTFKHLFLISVALMFTLVACGGETETIFTGGAIQVKQEFDKHAMSDCTEIDAGATKAESAMQCSVSIDDKNAIVKMYVYKTARGSEVTARDICESNAACKSYVKEANLVYYGNVILGVDSDQVFMDYLLKDLADNCQQATSHYAFCKNGNARKYEK